MLGKLVLSALGVIGLMPSVMPAQCWTDAMVTKRARRTDGNHMSGVVIGWTKNGDWWNWYAKVNGEMYFTPAGGSASKFAEGTAEGWSWGPSSSNPNEPDYRNPTWSHLAELQPRGSGSYYSRGWGTFLNFNCGIQGSQAAANSPAQVVTRPTVTGPQGVTSAEFWYLGGAPSIDEYYVQWPLTGNVNWFPDSGQPTPVKSWSTDSPSKLSISVTSSSITASNVTLTSEGHSAFGSYSHDITVTFSADGFLSAPFPVFINTPFTMTTSYGSSSCTALGKPEPGYVTMVRHGIADLAGGSVAYITTNESLENIKYTGGYSSANSNWLNKPPVQAVWSASDWLLGGYFIDDLWACGGDLNPIPGSGTGAVVHSTQKFWVGSPSQFNGRCVQRGVPTLFRDHGSVSPYYTPVINKSECSRDVFLNN